MLGLADPPAPPVTSDLESVELVLRLLEVLAVSTEPRGVTDLARELAISKPRAHRHLRALVQRGYARQDPRTEGYEIGIRVLALGEMVRDRFDAVGAMRPAMAPLREATGLTVTASAIVGEEVIVLEMLQGRTAIEFTVRPGSSLALHASAHGLVALAFGPPALMNALLDKPLSAFTDRTLTDPEILRAEIARIRQQGWATAVDAVQVGVNALAAPVFDHRGACRGAIALVGATQFIPETPFDRQVELVMGAARDASLRLGWHTS